MNTEIDNKIKYIKEMIERNNKRNEKLMLKIRLLEEFKKERECIICGKKFMPKRLNSVFCGPKCSQIGSELSCRDVEKKNEYAREYNKKIKQKE